MATYYMRADGTAANKAAATGPTSSAAACMSMATHNAETLAAGDTIILSDVGGDYVNTILTPPTTGSSGSPIRYTGAGSPVVSGGIVLTSWTVDGANWYKATLSFKPTTVWYNNARLVEVATEGELTTGEWWWDDPNDRVYIADDPSGATVIRPYQLRALDLDDNIDYITIQDIQFSYGSYQNILVGDCVGVILKSCNVLHSGGAGIQMGGTVPTDLTIESCEIGYTQGHGILNAGVNGVIKYNTIHDCGIDSPDTYDASSGTRIIGMGNTGEVIEYNTFYNCTGGDHGNSGHGLYLDECPATTVRYNTFYDNKWALTVEASRDIAYSVYYNVLYDNVVGIWLAPRNQNCLIYNNTCYNNEVQFRASGPISGGYKLSSNLVRNNIFVTDNDAYRAMELYDGGDNDTTNGENNVYEYNCMGVEETSWIRWGASYYSTYDDFETQYGGTSYSVEADPGFVNPTNKSFRLKPGSPCIGAGTDVSLTRDFVNTTVPRNTVDMGAYEYVEPSDWDRDWNNPGNNPTEPSSRRRAR